MHRGTHALLHCVALLSLLAHGNAAKGPAPEVVTHFARTVGTVLVPIIHTDQTQQQQPLQQEQQLQQQQQQNQTQAEEAPIRRQVGPRQIQPEDEEDDSPGQSPTPGAGVQRFPQGGFSFPLGVTNFRQPYHQQQNLIYPGAAAGVGPFDGQPDPRLHGLDPRLLQQFQNIGSLGSIQQGIPVKPLNPTGSSLNRINGNLKDTGSANVNINSIQDGPGDSKSSAQNNRPFDPQDFQSILNPGNSNVGLTGNYNRFGSGQFGYQNLRQSFYNSESPGAGGGGGQRNNFFGGGGGGYSDFPGASGGGGSPYQYSLNYNGGYGTGGYGSGSGLSGLGGESYFGNGNFFGQSPYQSLGGYNSLPGDGNAGGQGFPGNFQSPFGGAGGGFQGGAGANFPVGFFPQQQQQQQQGGIGVFGASEYSGTAVRNQASAKVAAATQEAASSAADDNQKLRFLHAKRRSPAADKTRLAAKRS